jgi:hypothetical protein
VAYDHRPGESLQANSGFGNGTDWSYIVPLANGHDDGRDNLLHPGEALDMAAWAGAYRVDNDPSLLEALEEMGSFDVDLFEINMHRTGVVFEGEYYGMNADLNGLDKHPLHKYPELAAIPDTYVLPEYQAIGGAQDVNVVFVREDWLEVPKVVEMGESGTVVEATPALTTEQSALIESMVQQGTMRRFYTNLILIPYDGPVTLDFSGEADEGETTFGTGNVVAEVAFDLTDILADETDFETPRLVYKADGNNVPFGITLDFLAEADAPSDGD